MKRSVIIAACLAVSTLGYATVFVDQQPAANGGTLRWSKLWIDPFGDNDLDSDAICYEDFVLTNDSTIEHLEWWGDLNPNLGFQIEFWKQDPGTIAYQPYAVFRNSGANPKAKFVSTDYAFGPDPSGMIHFSWDLPTPVELAKNDAVNPRWFVAIIGLTDHAPTIWSWATGNGGSHRTFQWVRADGNNFRLLGEGRALLISGTELVPEPAATAGILMGLSALALRRRR